MVNWQNPQTHWHTFLALNPVSEVQKFSVGQYKYQFDGLFVSCYCRSVYVSICHCVWVSTTSKTSCGPRGPDRHQAGVSFEQTHTVNMLVSSQKKKITVTNQRGTRNSGFAVVVLWVAGVINWIWLPLAWCPALKRFISLVCWLSQPVDLAPHMLRSTRPTFYILG